MQFIFHIHLQTLYAPLLLVHIEKELFPIDYKISDKKSIEKGQKVIFISNVSDKIEYVDMR